jgi:hypothetical protein
MPPVSFFTYYWINGQTFVGPDLDNSRFPEVKPVTWEDFFQAHSLEQLSGAYTNL